MVDSGARGGFVSWLRRGVALLGVGVLVGCGVVGDLGEDRSQLPVLLEDPMAAEDLLGQCFWRIPWRRRICWVCP